MDDYIRMKLQDDAVYTQLLLDYLKNNGTVTRSGINKLLIPELSEMLTEKQKTNKINNLITKLREANKIINTGSKKAPIWKLAE